MPKKEEISQLEKQLSLYAKSVLKSAMGRKLIKVPELAEKLGMTPNTLSIKLCRATFSAGFFLTVLYVLGAKDLTIPVDIKEDSDFFKDL